MAAACIYNTCIVRTYVGARRLATCMPRMSCRRGSAASYRGIYTGLVYTRTHCSAPVALPLCPAGARTSQQPLGAPCRTCLGACDRCGSIVEAPPPGGLYVVLLRQRGTRSGIEHAPCWCGGGRAARMRDAKGHLDQLPHAPDPVAPPRSFYVSPSAVGASETPWYAAAQRRSGRSEAPRH